MVYGGYMESAQKIVFVWRGTINVTNWLEDFTYRQVDYKRCLSCKVHEGFYLSYLSVAHDFLNLYKQLRNLYPQAGVVMTGASLGAALATIAALEVVAQIEKI